MARYRKYSGKLDDVFKARPKKLIRLPILFLVMFFYLQLTTYNLQLSFAESVALEDIPPLPEGTVLFEAEERFGHRGKVGGFYLKPSKYGTYYDEVVYYEGGGEEKAGVKPASIKMMYWKKGEDSFCGTYIIVMGDLSKFATVTFMVKGDKGGEIFEIGMNDTVSNKREDAVMVGSINRFLPGGITKGWQKVAIPLTDFFGADLSRVYSIIFHNNEVGRGSYWLDDIRFHTEYLVEREEEIYKRGYLLLDDFDHNDLNLLGRKANAYKKLPSVCEFTRVAEVHYGDGGRALRLDYDKQSTGWCGYYTLLNQIGGEYYDLTKYKSVSFMVKGEKGGETFELGMADENWLTIGDSLKAGQVEKYLPDGVTPEWQEVTIALEDFGLLDFSQMGSFVINFNKKQKGTVYIDDLKFHLKTEEELLEEW